MATPPASTGRWSAPGPSSSKFGEIALELGRLGAERGNQRLVARPAAPQFARRCAVDRLERRLQIRRRSTPAAPSGPGRARASRANSRASPSSRARSSASATWSSRLSSSGSWSGATGGRAVVARKADDARSPRCPIDRVELPFGRRRPGRPRGRPARRLSMTSAAAARSLGRQPASVPARSTAGGSRACPPSSTALQSNSRGQLAPC